MLINEIKTKIMVFGSNEEVIIEFNNKIIEQVIQYKVLGCILHSVHRVNSDPFKMNYDCLCDQARKSLFSVKQKLKVIGPIPPQTMFYIFNSLLKPIITYGSDVCGINKSGRGVIDKYFVQFAKHVLGVKQSTSTLMVLGESGQLLPSTSCIYNTVTFLNRVQCMNDSLLVKQVYNDSYRLHECGFHTWCSEAWGLFNGYNLQINSNQNKLTNYAKITIQNDFKTKWLDGVRDINANPGARKYTLYKRKFGMELYMHKVSFPKYNIFQ